MKSVSRRTDVPLTQPAGPKVIAISPSKLAWVLLLGVAVLVTFHIVSKAYVVLTDNHIGAFVWEFILRFDLDAEVSVPTWYSQVLLLFASVLAGYIAVQKYAARDVYRHYWAVLSAVMFYVSMDEGSSLHETFGFLEINRLLGMTSSYFNFGWVIPAFFFLGILGLIFLRFWWNLPTKTKRLFAISAVVYVVGAGGIEMVSAHYLAVNNDWNSAMYQLVLIPLEEGLEMVGAVLFIYALAEYISNQKTYVNLRVGSENSVK